MLAKLQNYFLSSCAIWDGDNNSIANMRVYAKLERVHYTLLANLVFGMIKGKALLILKSIDRISTQASIYNV